MGKQLSFGEFEVELEQMKQAVGALKGLSGRIEGDMARIGTEFAGAAESWVSPSGASFTEVSAWFKRASNDMKDLLDDANSRLETAYQNYRDAEQTALKNVS